MEKQIGSGKNHDSKVSREFLRKVLLCLGRKVPEEISFNSWELYDFIEQDISIILRDLKRAKGNIRNLMSGDEDRRQFTLKAIGDFYEKENGRQWKGECKGNKVATKEKGKVE